jgi:hypothetical protein
MEVFAFFLIMVGGLALFDLAAGAWGVDSRDSSAGRPTPRETGILG